MRKWLKEWLEQRRARRLALETAKAAAAKASRSAHYRRVCGSALHLTGVRHEYSGSEPEILDHNEVRAIIWKYKRQLEHEAGACDHD